MNIHKIISIKLLAACILVSAACSQKPANKQLQGNWKSKDGSTHLKITSKQFSLDNESEDYFLKGDTIFTSFEGNLPYTKFVIQKLDDKQLSLGFPDSVAVEFSR
ncbi:hypothetical protein A0256_08475 [Mucilaginibacter sp. PAMC 26640]|nr:hypothetical protein A0256_08475 [Mucilaginibacter sp. PAMC 26640]